MAKNGTDTRSLCKALKTAANTVYIDGNIVLDANSIPVVSDDAGYFDISVPIGNHYNNKKRRS
jgi:hypothetical protein